MAQINKRRKENVEGNFYVDSTCIDCDTCRWMAPEIYSRAGEMSVVVKQPKSEENLLLANQALLACPTNSIGTEETNKNLKLAMQSFPLPVHENVSHCGFHSDASFGAASYLIETAEGNILIDSPKFNKSLVKQLEEKGGVKYLFLTHIDDVADHQLFHDHFSCERIMHKDDIDEKLKSIEIVLEGNEVSEIIPESKIIPVPGHTKGHCVLLYRNKFLFTGDHLAWSIRIGRLGAFRRYCWYSWEEHICSMERLLNFDFEWVLPGHGRRFHAVVNEMHAELNKCISWMKEQS